MKRWLGILGIACMLCGCQVWEDVGDFFASGFADDEGSSDLTTTDLPGNWTLDVTLSSNTLVDAALDSDGNRVVDATYQGRWNVQRTLPQGFLSRFGTSMAAATAVEIGVSTFTFVIPSAQNVTLDYEVRDFDTVRFILGTAQQEDVTVVIPQDGGEMTITDTAGNNGTFQFENTRDDITSYTLVVDATTFVFTIMPIATGRPGTLTYTYTIQANDIITLVNTADNSSVDVDARLTNSNTTLTLTFPDGRVGEFQRNS